MEVSKRVTIFSLLFRETIALEMGVSFNALLALMPSYSFFPLIQGHRDIPGAEG